MENIQKINLWEVSNALQASKQEVTTTDNANVALVKEQKKVEANETILQNFTSIQNTLEDQSGYIKPSLQNATSARSALSQLGFTDTETMEKDPINMDNLIQLICDDIGSKTEYTGINLAKLLANNKSGSSFLQKAASLSGIAYSTDLEKKTYTQNGLATITYLIQYYLGQKTDSEKNAFYTWTLNGVIGQTPWTFDKQNLLWDTWTNLITAIKKFCQKTETNEDKDKDNKEKITKTNTHKFIESSTQKAIQEFPLNSIPNITSIYSAKKDKTTNNISNETTTFDYSRIEWDNSFTNSIDKNTNKITLTKTITETNTHTAGTITYTFGLEAVNSNQKTRNFVLEDVKDTREEKLTKEEEEELNKTTLPFIINNNKNFIHILDLQEATSKVLKHLKRNNLPFIINDWFKKTITKDTYYGTKEYIKNKKFLKFDTLKTDENGKVIDMKISWKSWTMNAQELEPFIEIIDNQNQKNWIKELLKTNPSLSFGMSGGNVTSLDIDTSWSLLGKAKPLQKSSNLTWYFDNITDITVYRAEAWSLAWLKDGTKIIIDKRTTYTVTDGNVDNIPLTNLSIERGKLVNNDT